MKFVYQARDGQNKVQKGVTEATSLGAATKFLIDQGWYISKIKPQGHAGLGFQAVSWGRVPHADLSLFIRHLATMIKSGISLVEALEIIFDQTTNQHFKKVIAAIIDQVKSGRTLSSALGRYPRIFDPLIINMLRAGEASGTLEANLWYLADELEDRLELRQKVRTAALYPSIVFLATIVLGVILAYFVLPKISHLFSNLNFELPLTTRILLATAAVLEKSGLYILIGVVVGVALFRFLVTRKFAKPTWHLVLLKLPVLGGVLMHYNLALISRTLGTLLKSGLTIDQAITVTSETVSNVVYQRRLTSALVQVERGKRLADVLAGFKDSRRKPLFPLMAVKMIGVGERSGQLAESLLYLADYFEREVDTTTKNLTTIVEPVLLLVIGLVVAFVALSVISPIYQITGQFNQ